MDMRELAIDEIEQVYGGDDESCWEPWYAGCAPLVNMGVEINEAYEAAIAAMADAIECEVEVFNDFLRTIEKAWNWIEGVIPGGAENRPACTTCTTGVRG